MREIPENSIPLLIADPPYNQGVDYGEGREDDSLSRLDYLKWCMGWIWEIPRILKPNGAAFVICSWDYGAAIESLMRSAGLKWRNTITWEETFGVHCKRKYSRTSRPIYYFVKSEKMFCFNEEAASIPSDRQIKYKDKRANPKGKTIGDVWKFSRVCGTFKERIKGVPNQIPVALLTRIVKIHSSPGDTILDPFMGSASTGAACLPRGRHFLGIEKSESQAEHGRKRLAEVSKIIREADYSKRAEEFYDQEYKAMQKGRK